MSKEKILSSLSGPSGQRLLLSGPITAFARHFSADLGAGPAQGGVGERRPSWTHLEPLCFFCNSKPPKGVRRRREKEEEKIAVWRS